MRKTFKQIMSIMLAAALAIGGTPFTTKASIDIKQEENNKKTSKKKKNYVEGQAVILYKENGKNVSVQSLTGSKIKVKETYDFQESKGKVKTYSNNDASDVKVSLVESDSYSTEELIAKMKNKVGVISAQPNYIYKASDYNDKYYKFQWSQENGGQNGGTAGLDVNADNSVLTDKDNKEKVVAIVDTGVDYTHEDLKDKIWNNPYSESELKGKHGYDFANGDTDPLDDNGHGSHCAGIVTAQSNNSVGISGTAKSDNIKIMALKFLDEEGSGTTIDAIGAYNYIYKAQTLGTNVVAVNDSWGGDADEDETEDALKAVIDMVGKKGALSVVASGNDGVNVDESYTSPACIDSDYIISVAASNEKDELATFSNYGTDSVDIAAPGTNILSSVSYNCYNPSIYDDPMKLSSTYYTYDNETPVNVVEDDSVVKEAKEGEVPWGHSTDDEDAKFIATTTHDSYFGEAKDTNKSLNLSVSNITAGEQYNFYLPYELKKSSTPVTVSAMLKVNAKSKKDNTSVSGFLDDESIGMYGIFDCDVKDSGELDFDNAEMIGMSYLEQDNYYTHLSFTTSGKVKKDTKKVLVLALISPLDGEYGFSVEDFGVSKEDINADEFGKYDFYNGTSMATPHVTGAVAAIANTYGNSNSLDVKNRVLGSVREIATLANKVSSSGVLDLTKVDTPSISVGKIQMNAKSQVEIKGSYLKDVKVFVNNTEVKQLSNNDQTVTFDGNNYKNKTLNIKIQKDEKTIERTCYFSYGKAFTSDKKFINSMVGGQLVSTGQEVAYITDTGIVMWSSLSNSQDIDIDALIKQFPELKDEILKEQESLKDVGSTSELDEGKFSFTTEMFGAEYKYALNGSVYANSDFAYTNGKLYGVVALDVGYTEEEILAYYDTNKGWKKLTSVPKEFKGSFGYNLVAYNGDLYLFGGIKKDGSLDTLVMKYSLSAKKWTAVAKLPSGRACAKAVQVGNKLVVTLGTDGTESTPKNLIFDGSKWTESKATIGTVTDAYKETINGKDFCIAEAQIGAISNGIIYTDLKAEGLGDTFIYNLSSDSYKASGYSLNSENFKADNVLATTVQDKLYVLYGNDQIDEDIDDDWDFGKGATKKSSAVSIDGEEEDVEAGIESVYINVTSGYANVVDSSTEGGYVEGTGYYLPGDTIKITAKADDDFTITKFTVNGKNVAKGKNGYVYTARANTVGSKVTAKVYTKQKVTVTKVGATSIKKAKRTAKKLKLTLAKASKATGYQIAYSTSKKFTKKTTKYVNSNKTSVTLKKLKNKKYYVKARAYTKVGKKSVYGSWSKVKTIKKVRAKKAKTKKSKKK